MRLVSGYRGAGKYKCLQEIPEERAELSLRHCGWESGIRKMQYRQDLKSVYVLGFVKSGNGTLKMGGEIYHLEQGDALLALPGRDIYYETDQNKPWTYMWIGFSGVRVEMNLSVAGFSKENPIHKVRCGEQIGVYIDLIMEAYQTSAQDRLKRNGMLLLIFSELIKDYDKYAGNTGGIRTDQGAVYVKEAARYMDAHYNEKIKIQEVADHVGVNRSYLASSFQKVLGCSPHGYLVKVRMEKARSLLAGTDLQICLVADSVGYTDPLAFTKIFKSSFGMSPRTYRKIAGKANEK